MITCRIALAAALLASGFAGFGLAAQGAQFASLDVIDREVAGYAGAGIGQPGGAILPVDRRLRLAPCQSPLALAWRSDRHDAVLVQCPDLGSWHLFVPVLAGTAASATPAVLRGEALNIMVSGDGFTVSQPGEAMEPGSVGTWIRVRTAREGSARSEPMRARIVRPGLVEVPLP